MQLSDLRCVRDLVQRYGVKAVVYGGPGTGKTPLLTTAPHPVHAFAESAMLAIRTSTHPGYMINTYSRMKDYTLWACTSQEAKQFHTKTFDSISQMAQIILDEEKEMGHKDPRKSYMNMGDKMMQMMNWIYFAPDMNAIMLAKETILEIDGKKMYRPLFPGQALDAAIPHLFDAFWRLEWFADQKGERHRVIRTRENFSAFARDRSGNLAELEPPDLTYLINKARQ